MIFLLNLKIIHSVWNIDKRLVFWGVKNMLISWNIDTTTRLAPSPVTPLLLILSSRILAKSAPLIMFLEDISWLCLITLFFINVGLIFLDKSHVIWNNPSIVKFFPIFINIESYHYNNIYRGRINLINNCFRLEQILDNVLNIQHISCKHTCHLFYHRVHAS